MRIPAYILLFSLTLPFVSKTIDVTKYLVSYDSYLAACENIERPEMQCNGTCQWAKEHAVENDGAIPPIIPESLKVEIVVFKDKSFTLLLSAFKNTSKVFMSFKQAFAEGRSIGVPTPPPDVLI